MSEDEAFVTLATNDSYAKGAIVLAQSLRQTFTSKKICCMLTAHNAISDHIKKQLQLSFDTVHEVDQIYSSSFDNLAMLGRPELVVTFTKILVWGLVQYKKIVFLDADMLILKPIDDLFERPDFSACPDSGWPDCFNTGMFVCAPNSDTLDMLLHQARLLGSFDGGDQGLLNGFFSTWSTMPHPHRIPFTYNVTFSLHYSYKPAFMHFYQQIKAVHFVGPNKPWMFPNPDISTSSNYAFPAELMEFVQKWWSLFEKSKLSFRSNGDSCGKCEFGENCKSVDGDMQFAKFKVSWADETDYLVEFERMHKDKNEPDQLVRIMPVMLDEKFNEVLEFDNADEKSSDEFGEFYSKEDSE